MNKKINVLVRAVIQNKGKILICKKTGKDYGKKIIIFPGRLCRFWRKRKKGLSSRD